MRDLTVLKERVERAERQLKATYVARERECDALMRTWETIRQRFESQEAEIARIRADAERLQQANDELTALVDVLLKSVDGNLHDATSEAVPQINELAQRMIVSEPAPRPVAERKARRAAAPEPEPEEAAPPAFDAAPPVVPTPIEELAELLAPATGSVEDIAFERNADRRSAANGHDTDARDTETGDEIAVLDPEADEMLLAEPLPDEPVEPTDLPSAEADFRSAKAESPGIHSLMSRIETAVSERMSGTVHPIERPAPSEPVVAAPPDPIDEGLDDVTRLRRELDGLRARLAVG